MKKTSVLSAAALFLVSACADTIPVQPTTAALSAFSGSAAAKASSTDQQIAVNPALESLGAQLGVAANTQLLHAEVLYRAAGAYFQSPTLIIANDRLRGIGAEWVRGDPRRGGRVGVKYGLSPLVAGANVAIMQDATTGQQRLATVAETFAFVDAGMNAWRDLSCSSAPISPAATTAEADIIHGLWAPLSFFTDNWGPEGVGILGVTLPFIFVDAQGNPTDIDGNGQADLSFAAIIYNRGYLWSAHGAPGTVDFFSVIAHEVGHALGINHFGKIFVTKKDQLDDDGQIFFDEVKFAPKALMNAFYFPGQQETLRGIDNGLFCSLWGSVKGKK